MSRARARQNAPDRPDLDKAGRLEAGTQRLYVEIAHHSHRKPQRNIFFADTS